MQAKSGNARPSSRPASTRLTQAERERAYQLARSRGLVIARPLNPPPPPQRRLR